MTNGTRTRFSGFTDRPLDSSCSVTVQRDGFEPSMPEATGLQPVRLTTHAPPRFVDRAVSPRRSITMAMMRGEVHGLIFTRNRFQMQGGTPACRASALPIELRSHSPRDWIRTNDPPVPGRILYQTELRVVNRCRRRYPCGRRDGADWACWLADHDGHILTLFEKDAREIRETGVEPVSARFKIWCPAIGPLPNGIG